MPNTFSPVPQYTELPINHLIFIIALPLSPPPPRSPLAKSPPSRPASFLARARLAEGISPWAVNQRFLWCTLSNAFNDAQWCWTTETISFPQNLCILFTPVIPSPFPWILPCWILNSVRCFAQGFICASVGTPADCVRSPCAGSLWRTDPSCGTLYALGRFVDCGRVHSARGGTVYAFSCSRTVAARTATYK